MVRVWGVASTVLLATVLCGCSLLFSESTAATDGGTDADPPLDAGTADAFVAPKCGLLEDMVAPFDAPNRMWIESGTGTVAVDGQLTLTTSAGQVTRYSRVFRYDLRDSGATIDATSLDQSGETTVRLRLEPQVAGDPLVFYEIRHLDAQLRLSRNAGGSLSSADTIDLQGEQIWQLRHFEASNTLELSISFDGVSTTASAAIDVLPEDGMDQARVELAVAGVADDATSSFGGINEGGQETHCPARTFNDPMTGPNLGRVWLSTSTSCATDFSGDGMLMSPASQGCTLVSARGYDLEGSAIVAHVRPTVAIASLRAIIDGSNVFYDVSVQHVPSNTTVTAARSTGGQEVSIMETFAGNAADVWLRLRGTPRGALHLEYSMDGSTFESITSFDEPQIDAVGIAIETDSGPSRFISAYGELP